MSKLQIDNTDFMVTSLIDRCPNTMMIRELIKNAMEAALCASLKKIVIGALDHGGTKKLRIWNTGPGMGPAQLRKACDLATVINKTQSLEDNFGMGAKVASLNVNKYGMRYRSCKNGKVSEVVMQQGEDNLGNACYERTDCSEPTGTPFPDVADVTDEAKEEGQDLSLDWTEVVLFGNNEGHNTVLDPFEGNPKVPKRWVANALYTRFFRIPDELEIIFEADVNAKQGSRKFATFLNQIQRLQPKYPDDIQYECVVTEDDIKLHYFFDAPDPNGSHSRSYSGSMASDASFSGVVFKDEIYDYRKGSAWYATAPKLRIPFGSKHISVVVEIPDQMPVIPDGYREVIRNNDQEKSRVYIEQFGDLIRSNIPEWLQEIIRKNSPSQGTSNDIRQSLLDLLKENRVFTDQYAIDAGGAKNADEIDGSQGGKQTRNGPRRKVKTRKPRKSPLTKRGSSVSRKNIWSLQSIPQFITISDEGKLEEHPQLKDNAAEYVADTNTVFVNMLYNAPKQLHSILSREYADKADDDLLRGVLQKVTEDHFKMRVGRTVVFALAKQSSRMWTPEQVERATSPESLSMSADDYGVEMKSLRTRLSNCFKEEV